MNFSIEKNILDKLTNKKNLICIFIVLITLLSLIIRYMFINYESIDYKAFLYNWFNYFKSNGGILALKNNIGDYNIPYQIILALLSYIPLKSVILIKLVSIFFDYMLAIISSKLVYKITNKKLMAILTYAMLIFLPSILINSSLWSQCDSIYAFFVISSIYLLISKKYTLSFILLGIAFGFKLQFIFILPLFIIVYFRQKEFSILNFFIIPVINIIMCLPAVFVGRNIIDCLKIYMNQTNAYADHLTLNMPNIYNIIPNNIPNIDKVMIVFVFLIFTALLFYILFKNVKIDNSTIIDLALLSIILLNFFLPRMHERYMYLGDILSVIYFYIRKKNIFVPIVISITSLYGYLLFLFSYKIISVKYISIMFGITIIYYLYDLFKNFDYKIDYNKVVK